MDFDLVDVADDQQWWVFERLTILQKMVVRKIKTLVQTFVFPAEIFLLPNVSQTIAIPTVILRTISESELLIRETRLGRQRMVKHFA